MNGNEFYSSIRNIDSPCYNDGKDCLKRCVGCRIDCPDWKKYVEQMKAEKRKLNEFYRARKLVENYEISNAAKYKEMRRKKGKKDS